MAGEKFHDGFERRVIPKRGVGMGRGDTVFCASGIPGGGAVRRETLSKFQTRFTTGKKVFSPSL